MTAEQFYNCLCTLNIPVAYGVFEEPQSLPYIIYELDGENDFCADNVHYVDIYTGFVELYSRFRDFTLEALIEGLFERSRISYEMVGSGYIAEEKMQCARWEIELI